MFWKPVRTSSASSPFFPLPPSPPFPLHVSQSTLQNVAAPDPGLGARGASHEETHWLNADSDRRERLVNYILSTYYAPGVISGTWDMAVHKTQNNKTKQTLPLRGVLSSEILIGLC